MDLFPARGSVVRRFLKRTITVGLLACFFTYSFGVASLPLGYGVKVSPAFAQGAPTDTPVPLPTSTPAPAGTNPQSNVWAFSPEVTEVGRNADRARQLLWWVWTHPGIYHAPIIAQLWGVTRNIVYVFIVLVLIMFGIGIMLGRRRGLPGPTFNGISSPLMGMQVPQVFMKLGMILLYVTFSYVLVLGLIQFSEVSMQFIKSLVGRDLFNVFFAGTGNIEANYTTFIGYYNTDQLAREMVSTSMFVIRLTSFTYYTMAVILILRTVILWFLLILSPFLALLMPFVFIRNTGWIWIGVFFQWLFYGPLLTLFVVALVNIWVAGIPFPFDFNRVNKPEGQVYKTSINILYGGPAQTLSSGNSANYVDTFAEYVIALVMLWTAMLLPWLLLRIFRDYCCSMLASANATMSAIFDRMRQYPPPAPPPPPSPSKTGMSSQLPFRQSLSDKAPENRYMNTARMREISKTSTSEIARAMDLSVSSLKDVSRLEMREKDRQEVHSTLERLSAPERITSSTERERYETVKSELVERARQGDKMAQTMLMASSERRTEMLAKQVAQAHAEKAFAPASVRSAIATSSATSSSTSTATSAATNRAAMMDRKSMEHVATTTNVSASQVESVLREATKTAAMSQQQVQSIAKQNNVSEEKVRDILAVSSVQTNKEAISSIAKSANVAEEQVAHVIERAMTSKLMTQSQVQAVAQQSNMSTEKVQEIVTAHNTTQSAVTTLSSETAVKEIATSTNTSTEKVREVLSSISEKGNATTQTVKEIAAKTNVSESAISSIVSAATSRQTAVSTMSSESAVSEIAKSADVSRDAVREVLTAVSKSGVVTAQTIKDVAQQTSMSEQKVATIIESSKQAVVTATPQAAQVSTNVPAAIAAQVGVTEDKVQEVMKEMSATAPGTQATKMVAEKVGMPEAKVQEIVAASQQQATAPVSIEEYEDVKGMWLSHYREAPVPVSDTIKDRENWVGDEEKKLTNILNLLTSNQPEMKQKGLEQVAEILPFMLLGGFSETETIGYIQAKLAATQQIKSEIVMKKQIAAEMGAKMEDTMVELPAQRVTVTQAQTAQVRTVEMPVEQVSRSASSRSDVSDISEVFSENAKAVTRASIAAIRDVSNTSTSEITKAMNVVVRSLSDVSRYEMHANERTEAQTQLKNVAAPQSATADQEQYQIIRNTLIERANKGDQVAQAMLIVSENKKEQLVKQILQQTSAQAPTTAAIAQKVGVPETAVESVLTAMPQAGDKKKARTSPVAEEAAVKEAAAKAGIEESKVKEIVAAASPVSLEEYEEVRSMWAKHYLQAPVPVSETVKDRQGWINEEERKLTNILNMITSSNPEQKQQGMEQVAEILPFMLLGGFSETETVAYIQAKLAATQQVKAEIQMQEQIKKDVVVKEETLIKVGGQRVEHVAASQVQSRSIDGDDRESLQRDVKETVKEALAQTTQEMTRASVSAIQNATKKSLSEVTQTMRSMVTSLKELSRLEMDDQTRHAVQSTLESIASPQRVTATEDRQQFEHLRAELVDRSGKGDALAQIMLMTGEKRQAALIQRAVSQQPIAEKVAASAGVSAQAVQTVLQSVHRVPAAKLIKGEIVTDIFKGQSEESTSLEQTTKALAAKAGIPEGKVKDVLTSATAGVSIDDYEEVKKMWIEHYRNSPVPTSDTIKSRHDWLAAEEKKLTNVLNLIVSFNPKLREQGMSEVAELLPFLLLGGFSDTEMTMYLRAKLEAAQQVKEEIERVEQAKQESQKEDVLIAATTSQKPPQEQHADEKRTAE